MTYVHIRAVFFLLTLPIFAFGEIQPKRPLSPQQELRVTEDARSVTVSGETFAYSFSRENGLISAVRVMGREVTDGTPIPDLVAAEQLNPDVSPYAARREKRAALRIRSAAPAQVVVVAEGRYTAEDGKLFPLRYSISYEISIDGVVLVAVTNTALDDCSLRWLTLSGGAVRSELVKFLNWMPEQSTSQSTRYQFRTVAEIAGEKLLAGTWIPWFWLGNQNVGLEVTTWDVRSQTFNQVDNSGRRDQADMFVVQRAGGGVRWDNFLIRRTRVFARPGWTRSGQFALAVTPSKKFDPYYATLKGAHLGPHQHVPSLTLPDEQQIRTLAQDGYNLVVGMANWRSGEYVPLNEADLRRTIALCHKYGMKIIPYMTLVDLSHATEAWREHGEEWAIEPTTEYAKLPMDGRPDLQTEMAYRNNDERETTLMCPGAEGWRTFWKQQVDRVIRDYDFDGIYFDFWYGRMACENARHGCGGRFRRATILGSREMLMYAYNLLKAKDPHAIIKANTNMLASALITSLVDIRLVGESTDAAKMDPPSRQWLYTSYRLGEPTEFLWADTGWNRAQRASFATLVNFLPQYYQRPRFEPRQEFDDFDVFRSFDDGQGAWSLGIGGQERLKANPPGIVTNVVERDGAMLATVINTRDSSVNAQLPIAEGWLAWEPLAERLLDASRGSLNVELAGGAYRHVVLQPKPAGPRLLSALGVAKPAMQSFDKDARRLQLSVEAVEGALVRFVVYSPEPVKKVTDGRGVDVTFQWTPETDLARFEVRHVPGGTWSVWF
jgi:hypothetical protein